MDEKLQKANKLLQMLDLCYTVYK